MTTAKLSQKLTHLWLDWRDSLGGNKRPLIPPRRLMFEGTPDPAAFQAEGREYLHYYKTLCQLQPEERMLDVGFGIGRKTIPLTDYLTEQGRYYGFEVNLTGVIWCEKHITSQYPHFQFRHDKIHHPIYNPKGKYKTTDHYFAYEPKDFHFVVLATVLPHLLPEAVKHYIEETERVLKKRGRGLIALWLLNQEALDFIQAIAKVEAHQGQNNFHHSLGEQRTLDPAIPEKGIAYQEDFVLGCIEQAGLKVQNIYYGSWCGRKEFLSFQDIITVSKP